MGRDHNRVVCLHRLNDREDWSCSHRWASCLNCHQILNTYFSSAFSKPVYFLLLYNSKDPDCKDEHGQTALHKAAMNGNLDCIKILIGKGAETHIQDQAGTLFS